MEKSHIHIVARRWTLRLASYQLPIHLFLRRAQTLVSVNLRPVEEVLFADPKHTIVATSVRMKRPYGISIFDIEQLLVRDDFPTVCYFLRGNCWNETRPIRVLPNITHNSSMRTIAAPIQKTMLYIDVYIFICPTSCYVWRDDGNATWCIRILSLSTVATRIHTQ